MMAGIEPATLAIVQIMLAQAYTDFGFGLRHASTNCATSPTVHMNIAKCTFFNDDITLRKQMRKFGCS